MPWCSEAVLPKAVDTLKEEEWLRPRLYINITDDIADFLQRVAEVIETADSPGAPSDGWRDAEGGGTDVSLRGQRRVEMNKDEEEVGHEEESQKKQNVSKKQENERRRQGEEGDKEKKSFEVLRKQARELLCDADSTTHVPFRQGSWKEEEEGEEDMQTDCMSRQRKKAVLPPSDFVRLITGIEVDALLKLVQFYNKLMDYSVEDRDDTPQQSSLRPGELYCGKGDSATVIDDSIANNHSSSVGNKSSSLAEAKSFQATLRRRRTHTKEGTESENLDSKLNGINRTAGEEDEHAVALSTAAYTEKQAENKKVDTDCGGEVRRLPRRLRRNQKVQPAALMNSKDIRIVERRPTKLKSLNCLDDLSRLRLKAEERRYRCLVRNVAKSPKTKEDYFANYQRSLAMGVNVLVGLFLTFLAGYWGVKYCGASVSFTQQLLTGLVSSLIFLVVEVSIFILRDHHLQRASRKNK